MRRESHVRFCEGAGVKFPRATGLPDPGKHRTHFYGFYASRVRASRREKEGELPAEPAPTKRRCPPSWARLISKVYHADPLTWRKCGGKLKIVAYVSDEISVKRILAELGLSPPEEESLRRSARWSGSRWTTRGASSRPGEDSHLRS